MKYIHIGMLYIYYNIVVYLICYRSDLFIYINIKISILIYIIYLVQRVIWYLDHTITLFGGIIYNDYIL